MFICEYCEIFKNAYFKENLWTAASETPPAKFFICLFEKGILVNVSQHSEENNCARVSILINVVAGLQLKPIFIQKVVSALVFSWQLSEIFNSNIFKEHCYKKKSIVITNVNQIYIANLIRNFLSSSAKISVFQHNS